MKKLKSGVEMGGRFIFIAHDKNGKFLWKDSPHNLTIDEGIEDVMDNGFLTQTWYIGLTGTTPTPAPGDTLASHAGWTEMTDYTGNRKEYVDVRSGKAITNSASKAILVIDQDASTVGGAFIANVASGTGGVLFCVAAFGGGDRVLNNGDTINVQYDLTFADDGV